MAGETLNMAMLLADENDRLHERIQADAETIAGLQITNAVLEAKVAEQAGRIKRLERQLREADGLIEQHANAEATR